MKRALVLTVAALSFACFSVNARGPGGVAPMVPVTGACNTKFSADILPPGANMDDASGFDVTITGTCNLSRLGHTALFATQQVRFTGPGVAHITNTSTYVAANGDVLHGAFDGTGTFLDSTGTTVGLIGEETYSGGDAGHFDDLAAGSAHIVGTAQFLGPFNGVGAFTLAGRIAYRK